MTNDPNRRAFLQAAGATTVAATIATHDTGAAKSAGSPYRRATELVEALANKSVSSL